MNRINEQLEIVRNDTKKQWDLIYDNRIDCNTNHVEQAIMKTFFAVVLAGSFAFLGLVLFEKQKIDDQMHEKIAQIEAKISKMSIKDRL